MNKIVWVLTILVSTCQLYGQKQRIYTNNFNTWVSYIGDHKINNKIGIHIEGQFRRNDFIFKPQQLLLRTGLNYYIDALNSVSLGYCFVNTYPYGTYAVKKTFPEHRLWQQLQLKSKIINIESINRIRLEQRWSYLPILNQDSLYEIGNPIFTNRLRVMQKFSRALKGQNIKDKSVYFTCSNELFINFGKNVKQNIFDQNRAFIGLGYKIPKIGRFEIGYLNQLLFKPDAIKVENNKTLLITIISNIGFKNS